MTSSYDERNRETAQTWSSGAPGVVRVLDAAGRLISSNNGYAESSYSYDFANQLLSETQSIAGAPAAWTVGYGYNADGLRSSMTYPGGEVVEVSYTPRNEIQSISAGGPPPLAVYSYNSDGTVATRTLENGTVASFAYNPALETLNVTHTLGGTVLQQRDYVYNSRGMRTATQINAGSWDVYIYDPADQITGVKYGSSTSAGATPTSTMTYVYDAVGNRTQVKRVSTGMPNVTNNYAVANPVNQYSTVNGGSATYDLNGNLAGVPANFLGQSAAQTASYDALNRLVSVTGGSNVINQTFDSKGRVASRSVNGVTTYFVWDDWNLIEERDATGTEIRRYVHGARADELVAMIDATGGHYYHLDAAGNVIALTDGGGGLEETYIYDAFGRATATSSAGAGPVSFLGNRFLFNCREWLNEVGIYDYRNRAYSPSLGRFMQTDPISFMAGDVNLYRYVGNNPANWVDPYGADAVPAAGGGYNFVARPDVNLANFEGSSITNPNPNYTGQCATGAQYLTGTNVNGELHDAPPTRTWRPGNPVGPNTPIGTMIASGWTEEGGYPNTPSGNHTGLFMGMNEDGTMNMFDQSAGQTLTTRRYDPAGYHEVVSDKKYDPKPSNSVPTAVPVVDCPEAEPKPKKRFSLF